MALKRVLSATGFIFNLSKLIRGVSCGLIRTPEPEPSVYVGKFLN